MIVTAVYSVTDTFFIGKLNRNELTASVGIVFSFISMIGAVNTVVNKDGKLIGHNTDGYGYMQSIRSAGYDLTGKTMTLLGAGGAASSIMVQAALDDMKSINILVR